MVRLILVQCISTADGDWPVVFVAVALKHWAATYCLFVDNKPPQSAVVPAKVVIYVLQC